MTDNSTEKTGDDEFHIMNLNYYRERLADQTLLDRALKVPAPGGGIGLAVPCGGTRRAGFCQIDPVAGARFLVHMLDHPDDFPNPRWDDEDCNVHWGEKVDFDAHDDYVDHEFATGRLYGYTEDAIKKHLIRVAEYHKNSVAPTSNGEIPEEVQVLRLLEGEGRIKGGWYYSRQDDEVLFTWMNGENYEFTGDEFDKFMAGVAAMEAVQLDPGSVLQGLFEIKCMLNRNAHHPAALEPRVIAEVEEIWFDCLKDLKTWGAITEWRIDTENDTVMVTLMGNEITMYPWTIGSEVGGMKDGWLAARAQLADHTGATELHPSEREHLSALS